MKCCKEKKKRWRAVPALLMLALVLSPAATFAQTSLDLPCDGNDPYSNQCPLDTWSIVLVVAGCCLGAYRLYKLNHSPKRQQFDK